MKMQRSRAASLSLATLLLLGCGTSATVELRDGLVVEGKIIASNRHSVYLDAGNGQVTLPRKEIVDIDHPGNGAATTGLILTAYGALNIAVGLPECNKQGGAFCAGVFLPAALGLALMGYGLSVWSSSRKALRRYGPGRELSRVFLSPTFVQSGANQGPGLVLVSAF